MTDFSIKKLPYDLTSNAGLALAGQYLKRLKIDAALDRKFPVGVGGIPNSNILKSYLGLLVQGKNDFDAIEEFRGDDFFAQALDVRVAPSCSTLRQRLDAHKTRCMAWHLANCAPDCPVQVLPAPSMAASAVPLTPAPRCPKPGRLLPGCPPLCRAKPPEGPPAPYR